MPDEPHTPGDLFTGSDRELRLLALLESLPFDVWVLDADGRYEVQNSVCYAHWGDVVGRRPEDVAPSEAVRAIWKRNNDRAFAGEIVREEVAYVVNGEQRHLYNIISPIRIEGQIVGLSGVNVDITQRVQAEQALRQIQAELEERVARRTAELATSNAQLRQALEGQQALAAIVELSPAVAYRVRNAPDWPLEYISQNVSQFGYAAQDLLTGRVRWTDITHPDDRDQLLSVVPRSDHEGSVERQTTYRIRTADGRWRWVSDHSMVVRDAGGALSHFQGIVVDVTEQRETQRGLLRSERMAAVGMLAAGVAHEFNNVFTSMLGFIQLVRETPGLPDVARSKLDRSLQIGQRAGAITQNLLAFTQSWQGVPQTQPLDEVVRFAVASVEGELRDDGIELTVASDPDIQVRVDRHLLGQVLVNLLINAQHALLARPVRRIHVRTGLQDGQGYVCVEDTGCGIPGDQRERLFLPFYTTKGEHAAADSPQAEVRGTGLGLSICETIVRDHGGTITVESEVDVGSRFLVHLPLAPVA